MLKSLELHLFSTIKCVLWTNILMKPQVHCLKWWSNRTYVHCLTKKESEHWLKAVSSGEWTLNVINNSPCLLCPYQEWALQPIRKTRQTWRRFRWRLTRKPGSVRSAPAKGTTGLWWPTEASRVPLKKCEWMLSCQLCRVKMNIIIICVCQLQIWVFF